MVRINDTDIFHGPHVELPEISFRDMAAFVNEAQRTIEARFEELEKEIYQSSARQVEHWKNLMRLSSLSLLITSTLDPETEDVYSHQFFLFYIFNCSFFESPLRG